MGVYRIYLGVGGVDSIDWTTPVGTAPAGTGTIDLVGLGHTPGVEYYYGIRAVSDSGVEETGVAAIVRVMVDAAGNLIHPPPPKLIWAVAEAAAAGKIDLSFRYDAPASSRFDDAVGVQVARVTAGTADWDNPLNIDGAASVVVNGDTIRRDCRLDDTFDHDETVELAVRAITTQSVGGAEIRLKIVADSVGPAAVGYLEAAQA